MRKSSQWVTLLRSHARVVANDSLLAPNFDEHCRFFWNSETDRSHCFSDEVYIPTLLAREKLGRQTTCCPSAHHVDWRVPFSAHPHSFQLEEINGTLCV